MSEVPRRLSHLIHHSSLITHHFMTLSTRHFLLVILIVALAAHGLLLIDLPLVVQTVAVLVLTGLLPGLLLVTVLVGNRSTPPDLGETILYAIGVGYGVSVVVMLLLSYLPGGITPWMTFAAFDVVLILLLGLVWQQTRGEGRGARGKEQGHNDAPRITHYALRITGLLVLLAVGGFLRFTNLGYAEFHGDEARAVLRAAAVIEGYEDVLFVHKKGPTEILLPAAIFSLTGHLNEAAARLPLAVANLATLGAIFLLGWRLLGSLAGWVAAFLLAFDGYLIAFSRFVQYQSVVLLTSALTVLIMYRLLRQPEAIARYLTLAAILLATGLLSHYDAAMAAVPLLFLLAALLWQQQVKWATLLRAMMPAVLVGGALVALFYVPFVLHPRFQATYTYLVDQRFVAGGSFPYNNLADVFRRSLVYNSSYYMTLMAGSTLYALLLVYQRGYSRRWGALASGILILALAVTLWRADWLRMGGTDFTVVPFALALGLAWFAPKLRLEERLLWLWFGALLLVACFFLAYARTHIYIFFIPWALLVGGLLAEGWQQVRNRFGQLPAAMAGGVAALAALVVFGAHGYLHFVSNQEALVLTNQSREVEQTQAASEVDSLYGFPLANGWKVIGALYAQGVIQGDYETNQRYAWIPDWYTRSQHRCASTASWYFAVDTIEPWAQSKQQAEDFAESQGFTKWGEIQTNGLSRSITKMTIYQRSETVNNDSRLQTFELHEYDAAFDALARPDLPLLYPIIEDTIPTPLHVNFDNQLWLEGYDLDYQEPLQPGDTFRLKLYWRGQRPIDKDYKVFNQSFYGDGVMIAQKDSYSVCDREPTTTWTPGKLITDIYDITVSPDAPAGLYPLYTGLYLEENFERLPVLDAAGNPVDNQVQVTDLRIDKQ